MADTNQVLTERGSNYGKFIDNATISQHFKEYMRNCPSWDLLDADQREALDNISIKLSRMLSPGTNKNYLDNWVDIAGYVTLVIERMEGIDRE